MVQHPVVTYEFSRLGFKREVIERLAAQQRFRVVTPVGTFEMSRADFEHVFGHICASRSWQLRGLYHYPRVPAKADRFRV